MSKGSDLSAGSSWTVNINSSTGLLAYSSANSYNILFSANCTSGGQELSTRNKSASSFDLNMYNRNSSSKIGSPSYEWFTIGY